MNQLASSTSAATVSLVGDRDATGEKDERHHGGNVMAKPEAVRRGDRPRCQVARRGGSLDRRRKQRVNLFEYPVEEFARILPVLEKAVEDKAQACVELATVDIRRRVGNTAP